MKGQFFVVATVIMIYTLMTMIQYIYDFSDINLVQLKKTTELDSIRYIKDVLEQTVISSNSSLDCNKIDIDLSSTEDFLEREMISRGINLTISHTIINCPPDVNVNFVLRIKSSNIYVETFFNPISPKLVGHWKLEEGYGTLARDSSGYGNDGTLINMESSDWVLGVRGTALIFDGVNERVYVPNDDSFDFADEDFSVGFWFKAENQVGIGYIFSKNYGGAGVRWYGCSIIGTAEVANNGRIRCYLDDGVNMPQPTTNGRYNDTKWHHAVFRRNTTSNIINIFVDGVLDASAADTAGSLSDMTVSPTNNLFIGVRADIAAQRWFNGTIDDIKIWNRSLSNAEIISEYG